MKLAEAITKFGNYMESQGKSHNTQKNAMSAIKRFVSWGSYEDISGINPDSFVNYRNYLTEIGTGGISINTYSSHLKAFFQYLHTHGHIDKDLSKNCEFYTKATAISKRGKCQYNEIEEEVGKVIPKEHIQLILRAASKSIHGKRNRLMIETGLICGLRETEIVNLKVRNIEFETGYIKIRSKRNKIRRFYIGDNRLVKRLENYLIKNNITDENDYIFQSFSGVNKGKAMKERNFTKMFDKVLVSAVLNSGRENNGYTTHDLRRTCATLLSEKGVPVRDIQKRLGHSNITTTERYLKDSDSEEKKSAIARAVKDAFR